MNENPICNLFKTSLPIVQGGMVWCSGWKLASTVSNNGGLGLIGAGSMTIELLREHILKCQAATSNSFGVNIPLLYSGVEDQIDLIIELGVKIVFTSAGNPKTWTKKLKKEGIIVVHVVSSSKFALKAQEAGVDAIVAEGFEAGGHNGREETTTLCLIPEVTKTVTIPVIAAGGIGGGKAIAAAFSLGASGVQIGSLFASCKESSAHELFKEKIINTKEGDTKLSLKPLAPVRLIKNDFFEQIHQLEQSGASIETLKNLLGKGRAKKGMFEGDLINGELEIGQVSSSIHSIKSVKDIIEDIWNEFILTKRRLANL